MTASGMTEQCYLEEGEVRGDCIMMEPLSFVVNPPDPPAPSGGPPVVEIATVGLIVLIIALTAVASVAEYLNNRCEKCGSPW